MSEYEDIIHLKRPVSKYHHPMPVEARAAQFAPFAALTGYDSAIADTAKMQEEAVEAQVEHILLEDAFLEISDGD